jgi:hypothetical protein
LDGPAAINSLVTTEFAMPAICAASRRARGYGRLHGAAYFEAMQGAKRSVATQKQHMAAVRMLFDYLVTEWILEH